jgi:hypothetical protein
LDLDAKNLIDVRGHLENLQDIKKTYLFHGSPGVQVQNSHLIFFLRPDLAQAQGGGGGPGGHKSDSGGEDELMGGSPRAENDGGSQNSRSTVAGSVRATAIWWLQGDGGGCVGEARARPRVRGSGTAFIGRGQ